MDDNKENVDIFEITKVDDSPDNAPSCKGQVYRAHISRYENLRGNFVETRTMIHLKRKSCTGCEKCGWEHDMIANITDDEEHRPDLSHVKHGKLYQGSVAVENYYTDWETGIEENDYCFEFVPYEK